jgi:hypothetical protein
MMSQCKTLLPYLDPPFIKRDVDIILMDNVLSQEIVTAQGCVSSLKNKQIGERKLVRMGGEGIVETVGFGSFIQTNILVYIGADDNEYVLGPVEEYEDYLWFDALYVTRWDSGMGGLRILNGDVESFVWPMIPKLVGVRLRELRVRSLFFPERFGFDGEAYFHAIKVR